jgi:hypothetical protein
VAEQKREASGLLMVDVDFSLFPSQIKALQATEDIVLMLCSRAYGKSYTMAMISVLKLLQNNYRCLFIAPTFSQLRESSKYVLQHLEKMGIEYAVNSKPDWCKSLLTDHKNIISINGGDKKHRYIKLISGDNPETIRGSSADFIVVDECVLVDESLIDISLPCLRGHPDTNKHRYQLYLASTPSDQSNWLYKRYIENPPSNFIEIKAMAQENFIEFNDVKIEMLKESMTTLMWKREMLCEWLSINSNSMNYAFTNDHIKDIPDRETRRLFLGCDQNNINLGSLCGWIGRDDLFIDGEILIPEGGNAIKVAQEFHKLYSKYKVRQVTLTGDRMGNNKTLVSGTSYYDQLLGELKRLGWNTIDKTNNKNPEVFGSNELLQRLMEQNKFRISPSCKEIIRQMRDVRWKKDEFIMDKKLLDSPFQDILRYTCFEFFRPGSRITATNQFL